MPGRRLRRRSGQALILVAAAVVVLTAILALALDGGGIYLDRRQLQNAADAGALAGAELIWQSMPPNYHNIHVQALNTIIKNLPGTGFVAGSIPNATTVGTPTTLPGSPPADALSLGGSYRVTLAVVGSYQYRVTIWHTHPVAVAPIHGFASTISLAVQATAQNANLPYAIVLLQGTNATYADLQMGGSGTQLILQASGLGATNPLDRGGVYSNASLDPGTGDIDFGTCTPGSPSPWPQYVGDLWAFSEVQGGSSDASRVAAETFCGQNQPNPTVNGSYPRVAPAKLPDPGYPEPAAPNVTINGATIVNGSTTTLCPGHYSNQVNVNGGGTAILYPGVYHIDAGGVSVAGTLRTATSSDSVSCPGLPTIGPAQWSAGADPGVIIEVTPANNSGSLRCDKHLFATIGGSSSVTLKPSPKFFNVNLYIETYPGWQAVCTAGPAGTNVVQITGGGYYSIGGIVYGPADNMTIAGGGAGSGVGQIVAWTLVLNGGGNVNETYNPAQLPYVKGLIQ